jgi:hypothetical protein
LFSNWGQLKINLASLKFPNILMQTLVFSIWGTFSKRRWGLFPELQTENDGDTEPGVRMCLEGVLKGTEGCLIDAWQQV